MQASVSYLCWAVILQSHLINEMKEILGNGETQPLCLSPKCTLAICSPGCSYAGCVLLQYWQRGAETVLLKCECAEAFMFIM